MKISIINCLIALKNASLFNKKFIIIKSNSYILTLIKCLYNEALILTFYVIAATNKIKIFLKYDSHIKFLHTLKILTTGSFNYYIKYLDLCKLILKHKIVFIHTTKGLITGKECKKYKLGGTVLFIS